MTDTIRIEFTLFSAFYSPLIATFAAGFLKEEGLETEWTVSPPGTSAIVALEAGKVDVIQSALSQGLTALDKGNPPAIRHFAQVNEMDGFFITAREPDPDFTWDKLEGSEVVMFGGGQPQVMFRYGCHKAGIDFDKLIPITPGGAAAIDEAFRAGQGQYVQQQGPYPQQLQADGVGHVVVQVGPEVGMCGFSSLVAMPDWLETDMALAFMRAYRKARNWLNDETAADIAATLKPYFEDTDEAVLASCIGAYQKLGNWTRHPEITEEAFQATQDIYQQSGGLSRRFDYNQVCAMPPDMR